MARSIPVAEVERTRLQLAEYKRPRELTAELVEVSDRLCQARLVKRKREASEAALRTGSRWRHAAGA